jgi:hypothetical protein
MALGRQTFDETNPISEEQKMSSDPMLDGRIGHVRAMCNNALERDGRNTDRAWLAQSVINILDGLIDAQIVEEINRESSA